MRSIVLSVIPFMIFVLAAVGGMRLRYRLKEHHKSPETTDLLRAASTMLVTFAALVLGLLITSAKSNYDGVDGAVHKYAAAILELDSALRSIGPPVEPARRDLISYTAAMIASTWHAEKPPAGDYYPKNIDGVRDYVPMANPELGAILKKIENALLILPATGPVQVALRENAIQLMNNVLERRWALISTSDVSFSPPFYVTLDFWLVVVFLLLGLTAPFNGLSFLTIVLSALAIASALFVIVDLSTLFTGVFSISSEPMRGALAQLLH